MHRRSAIAAALGAAALALPNVSAWASAAIRTKVITVHKSFTGPLRTAGQWGQVEVQVAMRKTTTVLGARKHTTKRIVAVRVPIFPNHAPRSIFINQQALPILAQETLQAQSTQIDLVSGATYTSLAFGSSLQAALLQAKAW